MYRFLFTLAVRLFLCFSNLIEFCNTSILFFGQMIRKLVCLIQLCTGFQTFFLLYCNIELKPRSSALWILPKNQKKNARVHYFHALHLTEWLRYLYQPRGQFTIRGNNALVSRPVLVGRVISCTVRDDLRISVKGRSE